MKRKCFKDIYRYLSIISSLYSFYLQCLQFILCLSYLTWSRLFPELRENTRVPLFISSFTSSVCNSIQANIEQCCSSYVYRIHLHELYLQNRARNTRSGIRIAYFGQYCCKNYVFATEYFNASAVSIAIVEDDPKISLARVCEDAIESARSWKEISSINESTREKLPKLRAQLFTIVPVREIDPMKFPRSGTAAARWESMRAVPSGTVELDWPGRRFVTRRATCATWNLRTNCFVLMASHRSLRTSRHQYRWTGDPSVRMRHVRAVRFGTSRGTASCFMKTGGISLCIFADRFDDFSQSGEKRGRFYARVTETCYETLLSDAAASNFVAACGSCGARIRVIFRN